MITHLIKLQVIDSVAFINIVIHIFSVSLCCQVPSLSYPAVAEAALREGPAWCRACAPYIV